MLPYLLVAAGGALGSVARYAVSLAIGNVWGDAFPWGTILVNITGCFLIGYIATLTLPQGPIPANSAVRLFLMVGICGGYTTFSSFSLQTLTLLQGGEWLGALANILISVVFCLGAVTLGFVAGQRSGVLFHREAASAMTTILAILNRPDTAHPVLAVAGLLAARLDGSRVDVLHVRHDALDGFMPTEEVMTDARRQTIDAEQGARSAELRATFDAWPHPAGAEWREAVGDTRETVAAESQGARLIVLGRAPRRYYEDSKAAFQAALMDAKAPVVLAPETAPAAVGRHVAVAWKRSAASGKAIEAAMPILLKAERVSILIGTEDGDQQSLPNALLAALKKHGIPAEVVRFELDGQTIGEALLTEATARGADLLVMGAYTHGRMEEAMFGGATRELIADATLPVLLHR